MRLLRPCFRVPLRHRSGIAGSPNRGGATSISAIVGLALLAAPSVLAAQQGTVTYTHVVKREIPPVFADRMREPPPPQTSTLVLHFSPVGSLMTREANRDRGGGPGNGPRFRGGDRARNFDGFAGRARGRFGSRPDVDPASATVLEAAYLDYGVGTMVESRRFLGRTFRVTRERPSYAWKIDVEQAEHLGYTVMRATAEHDSTTIEAWFTPQIPVSGGPASYGGLPGMILVLSLDGGQTQYQATEVSLQELEAGLIGPPEDGDEMPYEEFEQLVKERLDEMTRSRGPSGSNGPDGGSQERE